ncbi:MAG: hypothetical protein ACHREM_34065, partial [Polyangiales bacterium]
AGAGLAAAIGVGAVVVGLGMSPHAEERSPASRAAREGDDDGSTRPSKKHAVDHDAVDEVPGERASKSKAASAMASQSTSAATSASASASVSAAAAVTGRTKGPATKPSVASPRPPDSPAPTGPKKLSGGVVDGVPF